MSDTDTSLRDVHSIHTRSKPLAAFPAQRHTQPTLYPVSPLGCITSAHHTCHSQHAPALRDLRKSPYCPSLCLTCRA